MKGIGLCSGLVYKIFFVFIFSVVFFTLQSVDVEAATCTLSNTGSQCGSSSYICVRSGNSPSCYTGSGITSRSSINSGTIYLGCQASGWTCDSNGRYPYTANGYCRGSVCDTSVYVAGNYDWCTGHQGNRCWTSGTPSGWNGVCGLDWSGCDTGEMARDSSGRIRNDCSNAATGNWCDRDASNGFQNWGYCQGGNCCVTNYGAVCGSTNTDTGQCNRGRIDCNGNCVGEIGPSGEVCDGVDNDCDGSTDESLTLTQSCTGPANACGVSNSGTEYRYCSGGSYTGWQGCDATARSNPSWYGQVCGQNSCSDYTGGTWTCSGNENGYCSSDTPQRSGYNTVCNSAANSCGDYNTGRNTVCVGGPNSGQGVACNAGQPSERPNYGQTCQSAPNGCDIRGTGTYVCNGPGQVNSIGSTVCNAVVPQEPDCGLYECENQACLTQCVDDGDCTNGGICGITQCHDRSNGNECNADSDCLSDRCDDDNICKPKLADGNACNNNNDCVNVCDNDGLGEPDDFVCYTPIDDGNCQGGGCFDNQDSYCELDTGNADRFADEQDTGYTYNNQGSSSRRYGCPAESSCIVANNPACQAYDGDADSQWCNAIGTNLGITTYWTTVRTGDGHVDSAEGSGAFSCAAGVECGAGGASYCCGDDLDENYQYFKSNHDQSNAACDDVSDENCVGVGSDTGDLACCNNDNDCVWQGICYTEGSYIDYDGNGENDAWCMTSDSYKGTWRDVDDGQTQCELQGHVWTTDGEGFIFGEYDVTDSLAECCGDDAGEFSHTRVADATMDLGYTSLPSDGACCASATSCVSNGVCYAPGSHSQSGANVSADGDGDIDWCDAGTWRDCLVDQDCGDTSTYYCNANNDCDARPTVGTCSVDKTIIQTGVGAEQITATCTYEDLDGVNDIRVVRMLVNLNGDPTCSSTTDPDCGGYFTWEQSLGQSGFIEGTSDWGNDWTILDTSASTYSCTATSCTVSFVFSYEPADFIRYFDPADAEVLIHDISIRVQDEDPAVGQVSPYQTVWTIPGANTNLYNTVMCNNQDDSGCSIGEWCDVGYTIGTPDYASGVGLLFQNDYACHPQVTCYIDKDGDGYGDLYTPPQDFDAYSCSDVDGWVASLSPSDLDCNDEITGGTFGNWQNQDTVWHLDVDDDDYSDQNTAPITACERPSPDHFVDINDITPETTGTDESTFFRYFLGLGTDCADTIHWQNPDTVWYLDADDDGYSELFVAPLAPQCLSPGSAYKGYDPNYIDTNDKQPELLLPLASDCVDNDLNLQSYNGGSVNDLNGLRVFPNEIFPGATDSDAQNYVNDSGSLQYGLPTDDGSSSYLALQCNGIDYDCDGFGWAAGPKQCYADRDGDQYYEETDFYYQCATDYQDPTSCRTGWFNAYHVGTLSEGEDCDDNNLITNYLCCTDPSLPQYIYEKRGFSYYDPSTSNFEDWPFANTFSTTVQEINNTFKGACAPSTNYCTYGVQDADNTGFNAQVGAVIQDNIDLSFFGETDYNTGEYLVCNDHNTQTSTYGATITDCDNDANACNVYCEDEIPGDQEWVETGGAEYWAGSSGADQSDIVEYDDQNRSECCGDDPNEFTVTQYCDADRTGVPVCCPRDGIADPNDWRVLNGVCVPSWECPDIMKSAPVFYPVLDDTVYAATEAALAADGNPGTHCCQQDEANSTGKPNCVGPTFQDKGCYIEDPAISLSASPEEKRWSSQSPTDNSCVLEVCNGNYELCEASTSCQEEMIPLAYEELQGRVICDSATFTLDNRTTYPAYPNSIMPASCDETDIVLSHAPGCTLQDVIDGVSGCTESDLGFIGCEIITEQKTTCTGGIKTICDEQDGSYVNCQQVCESYTVSDVITVRGAACEFINGCEPTDSANERSFIDQVIATNPSSCTDATVCNAFGCNAAVCGECTAAGCPSCAEAVTYFAERSSCEDELICYDLACDSSTLITDPAYDDVNLFNLTELNGWGQDLLVRADNDNTTLVQCTDADSVSDQGDWFCPPGLEYSDSTNTCVRINDYCDAGSPGNLLNNCNDLRTSTDQWNLYNQGCVYSEADSPSTEVYNNVCCLALTFDDFEVYGRSSASQNNVRIY